jgi:hypothetical protein
MGAHANLQRDIGDDATASDSRSDLRRPRRSPHRCRVYRDPEADCYRRVMVANLPDELGELVAELERRGFSVVMDKGDDALGDRVLELADPARETAGAVRLDQDRGLWSAGIQIGDKWRDPYQVLLALDGSDYATRASSHEERRRFTLGVIARLPRSSSELTPVIERLDAFDRRYWRRFDHHTS